MPPQDAADDMVLTLQDDTSDNDKEHWWDLSCEADFTSTLFGNSEALLMNLLQNGQASRQDESCFMLTAKGGHSEHTSTGPGYLLAASESSTKQHAVANKHDESRRRQQCSETQKKKRSDACMRKDRLTLAEKLEIIYLHSSNAKGGPKTQVNWTDWHV